MSTARQITSLPRAGSISLADQFAIWQSGRTHIIDLMDVVAFLQVGLKGDKGDKGDTGLKGDKGDQGNPGTPADTTLLAPKADPVFSGIQKVTDLRFHDQVRIHDEYDSGTQQSRIKIERVTESNNIYADLFMRRDTTQAAPGTAGVSTMFRIEEYVGNTDAFQWPVLVKMQLEGTGNGVNHVCITNQLYALKDAGFYGMCGENRDGWRNPSTASVGIELDLFGLGGDNSGNRVALDIVTGAYYPLWAGDHTIHCGIRISPLQNVPNWTAGQQYPDGFANPTTGPNGEILNPERGTGRALMNYGVQIKGNVGVGIDFSNMRLDYATIATLCEDGQSHNWKGGGKIGFDNQRMYLGLPAAGILPGGTVPATAAGFVSVNIGGVGNKRIPYYDL